jgi:hypothetical protein
MAMEMVGEMAMPAQPECALFLHMLDEECVGHRAHMGVSVMRM